MGSVAQLLNRDYFPKWEHDEPTKRPYRVYCAKSPKKEKPHDLVGRRYTSTLRAHDQALLLVRWEQEGTVFEVYDVRNGALIGIYQRAAINGRQVVQFRVLKGGQ